MQKKIVEKKNILPKPGCAHRRKKIEKRVFLALCPCTWPKTDPAAPPICAAVLLPRRNFLAEPIEDAFRQLLPLIIPRVLFASLGVSGAVQSSGHYLSPEGCPLIKRFATGACVGRVCVLLFSSSCCHLCVRLRSLPCPAFWSPVKQASSRLKADLIGSLFLLRSSSTPTVFSPSHLPHTPPPWPSLSASLPPRTWPRTSPFSATPSTRSSSVLSQVHAARLWSSPSTPSRSDCSTPSLCPNRSSPRRSMPSGRPTTMKV